MFLDVYGVTKNILDFVYFRLNLFKVSLRKHPIAG